MLISDDYSNYVRDTINLVRGLVIKSQQTIDSINSYLSVIGYTVSSDPTTWKYYLNLVGQYHPSDIPMQIYSLDTKSLVSFDSTTMLNHPMTMANLRTYQTTYDNLVAQYELVCDNAGKLHQTDLIRGIISPIPSITDAIAADNYTILHYNKTMTGQGNINLIGLGEYNLINDIQQYINNVTTRWEVPAFAISDPLYPAAFLGILYVNLVPAIIAIRLENCKTDQVHEYHIWNYLSGYFNISQFKDILPYEQAFFLYRNIDWITHNAGKKSTLNFLNSNFAYPFGIQLYSFDIRIAMGTALDNLNLGNLKELNRETRISRYPYNQIDTINSTTRLDTPDYLVNKLVNSAPLNLVNLQADTDYLNNLYNVTPSIEMPTGVIDAEIIVTSTVALVYNYKERINYWLYLTTNGKMDVNLSIDIPGLAISGLSINAQDAAILLIYASSQYFLANNKTTFTPAPNLLVNIPTINVMDIMQPITLITEYQARGLIDNYISSQIDYYSVIANHITFPNTILYSLDEFNNFINSVINNKVFHILLKYSEPSSMGQSEIQTILDLYYQNSVCAIATAETKYADFFNRIGFDPSTLDSGQTLDLINTILQTFVGILPETYTLQQPYEALIEILRTVCSYTIQFVEGNATNDIEPIDLSFSNISWYQKGLIDPGVGIDFTDSYTIISNGLDVQSIMPLLHEIDVSGDIELDYGLDTANVVEISATIEAGLGLNCTTFIDSYDRVHIGVNVNTH